MRGIGSELRVSISELRGIEFCAIRRFSPLQGELRNSRLQRGIAHFCASAVHPVGENGQATWQDLIGG